MKADDTRRTSRIQHLGGFSVPLDLPGIAPALAMVGILVLSGCNVMRAPWQPASPDRSNAAAERVSESDSASVADTVTAREEDRTQISSEAAEAMRAAAGMRDTTRPGARKETSRDSTKSDRGEVPSTVEGLKELGPTFVRYDESPELQRTDRLTELLESHLLPVLEEQDLSLRTSALFWVLVTPEGSVADVKLHTTSAVDEFDEAAAEVARSLLYDPARRGGKPVPVWVLTRVHLLMP